MDSKKKKILIIAVVILILILFIFYLINNRNSNITVNNPNSNPNYVPNNNEQDYKLVDLTDSNIFFAIQNVINNYYSLLAEKNNQALYKILDNSFKSENNIDEFNASNVIYSNYESVSYTAKEIYYKNINYLTYYFVNGYLFSQSMMGDNLLYDDNLNFLVIVSNNSYVIRPLKNVSNILTFATDYKGENISIQSGYNLQELEVKDNKKLEFYLNDFINLMFLDSNRAYQMLDEKMLIKYPNLSSFENDIENIYELINSQIFGINLKEENNLKIYTINDEKNHTIIITEEKIMKYKINF